MDNGYSISDAEWQVMKVIWRTPYITLKEIADSVEERGWSYSTVRTLVGRLAEKQVIAADKTAAKNFKYYPVAAEEECKINEVKSFLDRVFNGSAGMLVSMLAKDSDLSEKEQEELQSIISKLDNN